MTDHVQEEILAPFLVLLIGRLLNWADVPRGGGDPQFLTGAQTEALAAHGISLLARYLPQEAAKRVTTAVEPLARAPNPSYEQVLLHIGAGGGVVISDGGGGGGGGCCVLEQRGYVCVGIERV
jgi:hypothetical protein